MSEENKAVIRRLYEKVWNQHNPEAADEFVAPDVFNRDMLPEYQNGIDGYKHLVSWMHTAFPDLRTDIENMIAEGDEVATFRDPQRHPYRPLTGPRPDWEASFS